MEPAIQRITSVPRLPKRNREGHKGSYGKVLVLGGSAGMLGAPALVAWGALRGGAGLVTAAVPRSIQQSVTVICPCATTIGLPESPGGQLEPAAALRLLSKDGPLDESQGALPSALVVGPGIGRSNRRFGSGLWTLIDAFRQRGVPVVADADALNALEHGAQKTSPTAWQHCPRPGTIITPHPGELARMHDVSTMDIQADRMGYAVRTARMLNGETSKRRNGNANVETSKPRNVEMAEGSRHKAKGKMAEEVFSREVHPSGAATGSEHESNVAATQIPNPAVVVLKGAGTIVTDGLRAYVNTTGNPGMATGGSGDVLGGLIGALLGQGMGLFEAAVAGVYLHGLAGDLAARDLGQVSMTALDVIDYLPMALRKRTAGR